MAAVCTAELWDLPSLQNYTPWPVPGLSGQTGFSVCFRIMGAAWVVIHHFLEPAGRMVAGSVAGDPGPWGHKERALTYEITVPAQHHTARLACMVIMGTCVRLVPRFSSLMLPPVPCVFVSPKSLPYLSRGPACHCGPQSFLGWTGRMGGGLAREQRPGLVWVLLL